MIRMTSMMKKTIAMTTITIISVVQNSSSSPLLLVDAPVLPEPPLGP